MNSTLPKTVSLRRASLAWSFAAGLAVASAQVTIVQTNYVANGTVPASFEISSVDLLQTNLDSATRTGAPGSGNTYFYREDSGYTVDLSRLSDGAFGTAGSTGLGNDGNYTVMPNNVTLTFDFDITTNTAGYTLTSIRTYAGWDTGRDGQDYTIQYSLVDAPATYLDLIDIAQYNPTDNYSDSHTLVVLTGEDGADMVEGVASLRFVFAGFENGGTAYREFDIIGTATTAVPEPGTYALLAGCGALGLCLLRRARRLHGGGT